ncbi:MAG: DUF1365 domain-containing protein [Woeseiaceae bacterium]|nr:DUF1365 domain-containing protein [Woeseiaceae bacterium]
MQSCIYEGRVSHTRAQPAQHRFSYRLFMMYLDLDELPTLFEQRWLWSADKPAIARFRRERHLGPSDRPLADCVRDLVQKKTGHLPAGPVRLLTNLSYFGYWMNPASFYYCFGPDGETLEAIVAEVTNTPWGEQDCYVLNTHARAGRAWRFTSAKKLHVSPFMPMKMDYGWVMAIPNRHLSVFIANSMQGRRMFDATLSLERREISAGSLAGVLLRFPFQTARIVFAIHWQALKLWLKRCPIYPHPKKNNDLMVQQ